MNTFFECKMKYEKVDEKTGKQKKVNLPYLIDAVSYTEAESRIYEEMEKYISGEFLITNIKKCNYSDVFFYDDGDKWWEAKVIFETVDDDSGKQKKTPNKLLVLANDLEQARLRIDESLQGILVDYEIKSIKDTLIADIFTYFDNVETN